MLNGITSSLELMGCNLLIEAVLMVAKSLKSVLSLFINSLGRNNNNTIKNYLFHHFFIHHEIVNYCIATRHRSAPFIEQSFSLHAVIERSSGASFSDDHGL